MKKKLLIIKVESHKRCSRRLLARDKCRSFIFPPWRLTLLLCADRIVSVLEKEASRLSSKKKRSCYAERYSCCAARAVLFPLAKVLNLFISRTRAASFERGGERWVVPDPRCLPETKKAFIRETPLAANFFFSFPRSLSFSSSSFGKTASIPTKLQRKFVLKWARVLYSIDNYTKKPIVKESPQWTTQRNKQMGKDLFLSLSTRATRDFDKEQTKKKDGKFACSFSSEKRGW